ncbi:MAG: phage major capsid protein [Pseudonocardia sp.]|nr:phage major capsid protein [Pseudonocardia sp.]
MAVDIIDRLGAAGDVPGQIAEQIVGAVETESVAMTLGRRVPTSTKDSKIPVLTAVPEANWLSSDTGRKPVTSATWENQSIIAEELATIVVIPDAVLEDSEWDLWAAVRPLVARSFARRIDRAVLFGEAAPASFGTGLVARAVAAGHVVAPTTDAAVDLLAAAEEVALTEHIATGAVVRPGWQFTAARQRTHDLVANPLDGALYPLTLAGMGIRTNPVFWDPSKATAIIAAWENVLVGVRKDITFEMFNTGVLQDEDGAIAVNLLQQDSTAMRCVMRVGHHLATPVNGSGEAGVPVAVVDAPDTP